MTGCQTPFIRRSRARRPFQEPVARRGVLALAVGVLLTACEFPTAPPIFESRFVMPESGTTLGVNQLLPASVTPQGGAFRITVPGTTVNRTLASMCGEPCNVAAGHQVPKPAFSDAFTVTLPMPADVSSAVLQSGSATVTIRHGFGFDPLRPAGRTENGTMTIVLLNAGRQIGSATVDQAFPSGTTVTRTIPLAPGTLAGNIEAEVRIISPEGGAVTINPDAVLTVGVQTNAVEVSEATVQVLNQQVSAQSVALDLSDVDETMRDRVRSGAIVMTIENPLDISGTLLVHFHGTTLAPKQIQVSPGTTTQRLEFTQAELQQLLGSVVVLTIVGPVTGGGAGNTITVTPGQQVTVTTLLDLIIAIGA
jgi:hypothetical protein